MDRREFIVGVPASLLIATNHSWAKLLPPLQPSPAIVNPVFRSTIRPWISLDGEWDLYLDPNGVGLNEGWFGSDPSLLQTSLLHKVNVPGAWEAQGVGKPGLSHATHVNLEGYLFATSMWGPRGIEKPSQSLTCGEGSASGSKWAG